MMDLTRIHEGFISDEHRRVADIIKDYDPTLELKFVAPEDRSVAEEFCYMLVHIPLGRQPYIVRWVRQEDMNEKLLAWIFDNDQEVSNPIGSLERAEQALALKKKMEIEEEKAALYDFAQSVVSGKNWYRHNGKVYS